MSHLVTIYRDTQPDPDVYTDCKSATPNPTWTGEVLAGPRADGHYWCITERADGVTLYLCRATDTPDTYEWMSWRCGGLTYPSRQAALDHVARTDR